MKSDREPDDRELREALLSGDAPPAQQGACPADDRLWAACHGELSETEVAGLLDHALRCGRCAEALALAREVAAGMAPEAAVVGPGRADAPWRWIGLIAAAALLISVPIVWSLRGAPDPDALRDSRGAGGVALRSRIGDDARLSRDAFVLRWSGGPEDALYTVELVDASLAVVDRVERISGSEYRVPPERLSEQAPGSSLRWRVEAAAEDGSRAESPAFRITLAD